MKKATTNRFLTFSWIGFVSLTAVVWIDPDVILQPADSSVAHSYHTHSSVFIWPTQGTISQGFSTLHEGLDISGSSGTPIIAAASGEVVLSGWENGGLGNAITLQHPDGSRSVYGHNSRLLVRKGEQVTQGQIIAEMGSTGNSTGPHLHFEVYTEGRELIDPLLLLPPLVAGTIPPLQSIAVTLEPFISTPLSKSHPVMVEENQYRYERPTAIKQLQVKQGQIIDERDTEDNSTAPYLDFEIYSGER